ncbi:hypothetical protein [Sabulibacter ruber]|uniref:hypothetical protein n=1 Tax=Sabulibacter ruber TaxID=2811901 RepID=UPI001A97B2C0|nr:hypothetical protein [Sabulibacter ruber]
MQNKRIYIDEFGNTHSELTPQSSFSHFVYTTLILDEAHLEKAYQVRNLISQKYFNGQPVPSNGLPNNTKGFKKRLQVLEELVALNFDVLALVVNKKEFAGPGLKRKEVLYKFFSKLLIKQFPTVFTSFSIYANQLGQPEFQADLKSFLNTTATQRDLFNPDRYYTIVDNPAEEPLLELANFLAGCLGLIYCNSHSHPRSKELFDLLYKRLSVDFAPFEKTEFSLAHIKENKERDTTVKRLAEASAIEVLRSRRKALTPESKAVLEYLYMVHRSAPSRLVGTYEIIERVQIQYPSFNERAFRQSIQNLRDLGVIITSIQGKSGYKLPDRLDDIIGFYKRYMGSIVPMLNRVDHCNRKLVWSGIILEDILSTDENFGLLTELIGSVKKIRLAPQLELE